MLFKRRKSQGVFRKIKESLWPSMGWQRAFTYLKHRIIRLKDSPHRIASGLAIGVAISFSPLIGTHFIQCVILCYIFRANMLASFLGTVVGNPTTFPFIWWISYELGAHILKAFGMEGLTGMPAHIDANDVWDIFKTQFTGVFWPWMLGGYILAVISWFPSYWFFKSLITAARVAQEKARETLRLHRVHKVAKEVTGQKK